MKVAIYARVSTETQTYEQQITRCEAYCKAKGWEDYDVFKEIQSSVKKRPVFEDVLRRARHGEYNVIVVFRLDRAWRKSRDFIMDYDNLKNTGVEVISVTEGLDPTTPMGKAMMTILIALAELERVQISEATKARLQALKNQGKKLGRPKGSKDRVKRKKSGYYRRWSK